MIKFLSKILFYILAFIFVYGLGQVLGLRLAGMSFQEFANPAFDMTSPQMFASSGIGLIFTLVLTGIFLKFDKESLRSLGLNFNINQLLQGFLLGGVFVVLFFLVLAFTSQIFTKPNPFNMLEFVSITLGLFAAAMVEEVVFRGYLFIKFSQKYGDFKALIISSIIFAAFHLMNPNLGVLPILEIFLAGLVIGYAYLKTKNLWFVTFLHMGWNWAQTLIGYNVSGNDLYSLQQFTKLEDNIWTGGLFGFEGSILSAVSMVLIFLILTQLKTKKYFEN